MELKRFHALHLHLRRRRVGTIDESPPGLGPRRLLFDSSHRRSVTDDADGGDDGRGRDRPRQPSRDDSVRRSIRRQSIFKGVPNNSRSEATTASHPHPPIRRPPTRTPRARARARPLSSFSPPFPLPLHAPILPRQSRENRSRAGLGSSSNTCARPPRAPGKM